MQTITVASVEAKTFDRKDGGGKGTFYILKDTDGNEFTSFDTKLKDMQGAVLDIEVKVSKGKVNIEKWVVKEEPKASASGHGEGKSVDQVRLERRSIEAVAAFTGMVELIKAQVVKPGSELADLALRWARVKMGTTLPSPGEPPAKEKEAEKPAEATGLKPARDPATITTINDLYKACHEDWSMQPEAVLKELGYSQRSDIIETPADCYRRISAVRS